MRIALRFGVAVWLMAIIALSPSAQSPEQDSPPSDAAKAAFDAAAILSFKERRWVAEQLFGGLWSELLTPDAKWAKRRPELSGDKAGICRMLDREAFDKPLPGIDGGGAYYSFTSRSNDYQKVAQLGLERWRFRTGFAGSDTGIITQIAADSVEAVTIEELPLDLTPDRRHVYAEHYATLREMGRRLGNPAAAIGGVYALRAVMWGECDVLVAFEVLEKDERGLTLGWRILKMYPTPER